MFFEQISSVNSNSGTEFKISFSIHDVKDVKSRSLWAKYYSMLKTMQKFEAI